MTAADAPSLPPICALAHFATIDSTNLEAARRAADGAQDNLVVWADTQTDARGRQGRAWQVADGGLFASILCRPNAPAAAAAQLSFAAGLALAQTCGDLCPPMTDLRLKWPNDLLINGRKAGGVLLEAGPVLDGRADWIVVGAGLNIAAAPELPADAAFAATSIRAEGGTPIPPAGALERFVRAFLTWRDAWAFDGFDALRKAWLSRAAGRGEAITAQTPAETIEGIFVDLDDAGALVIEGADGARRSVTAGDVFFPAGR